MFWGGRVSKLLFPVTPEYQVKESPVTKMVVFTNDCFQCLSSIC